MFERFVRIYKENIYKKIRVKKLILTETSRRSASFCQ